MQPVACHCTGKSNAAFHYAVFCSFLLLPGVHIHLSTLFPHGFNRNHAMKCPTGIIHNHFILSGKSLCSKKYQGMLEVQEISCSNGTRSFIEAFIKYQQPCHANQFTFQNARFTQIQFNTRESMWKFAERSSILQALPGLLQSINQWEWRCMQGWPYPQ